MAANLTSRTRREYRLTVEQWAALVKLSGYRGASLYETMGPNWKDIYWSPRGSPSVVTKLSREQVAVHLGTLARK